MQGKNRVIELRLLKQLCTCKHTGTHRGPFLNVVSDAKVRTFMVGRAIESGKVNEDHFCSNTFISHNVILL